MVNFYLRRVTKGLMEVEDVPPLWRSAVEAAIAAHGETES